jgi:hypothetical protein
VSPTRRKCILCDRKDEWNVKSGNWEIKIVDGELEKGEKFCMHEWDITGTHKPIIEII